MNSFIRKLKWLMGRSGKEAELQEELRFHLEEEMDERAAAGLDESPTPLAARRSLGNLGRVAEDTRAAWGWPWVEQFFQDVGYALRTLAANRTFVSIFSMTNPLSAFGCWALAKCASIRRKITDAGVRTARGILASITDFLSRAYSGQTATRCGYGRRPWRR